MNWNDDPFIKFWYALQVIDFVKSVFMKSQKYYELVRRYEQEAKQHPIRFQRRTSRYIWIGYAYICFILLLMFGITAFASVLVFIEPQIVLILGLLIAGFFTLNLVANLLEKIPTIDGIRLKRDQLPILFEEMDALREQMDVSDFHEVVLSGEMNASAGEHRSRGLVGKKTRTLNLGMPLLEAMNVDEFRIILGHEIAHLARGHSKLHARVWHLRNFWLKILGEGEVSFWWRWFAMVYADRFEAMAAVISREFEFEADRIASEAGDKRANISSHLKMELLNSVYDIQQNEWINAQIFEDPKIPTNLVSTYCQRLKQPIDPVEAKKHLRRILAVETSIYLTHPSCRDRIAKDGFPVDRPLTEMVETALAYINQLEGTDRQLASHYFLGPQRDRLLRELDDRYVSESKQMWEYRTEFISHAREELNAIEKRIVEAEAIGRKPDEEDLEIRANIFYEIMSQQATCESYEKVLEYYPENARALFVTGEYAFQREFDLEKAEDRFIQAVESDPRLEFDVSSYMVAVCRELENPEEAERWHQHSFGALDALNDSYGERAMVKPKDKFIPADLTEEQIDKIVSQIAQIDQINQIGKVWIACKKLNVYTEKPLYVFGIETNDTFKFRSWNFYESIGDQIANTVSFGNQFFVIILQGENKKFKKKFKKLKPSLCIEMKKRLSENRVIAQKPG